MPYADTAYPRQVRSGDVSGGNATILTVEGKDVGIKKPKGFTSDFFEYQVKKFGCVRHEFDGFTAGDGW